jgi:DNA-binding transcriptional LysR family regulator
MGRTDLTRIDLNLLVALDVLLTECNVTRAAAQMSVGQSAMSSTLARLRLVFDDPILVREGRRLVPTAFAESIVDPLAEALAQLNQVVGSRLAFDPSTARLTFSIMATDYVTPILLHPLLTRISREAPHVELKLFAVSADAVDQLRRHQIDLLIHPLEILPEAERFETSVLYRAPHVAAVDLSNDDIQESLTEHDLGDRRSLATLIADRLSWGDVQVERFGIVPNRVLVSSGALGPFLIRGTPLFGIFHETAAMFAARETGALRLLELPVPFEPVTEAMVWLHRRTHEPAHRWLRDTISSVSQVFEEYRWDRGPVPFRPLIPAAKATIPSMDSI